MYDSRQTQRTKLYFLEGNPCVRDGLVWPGPPSSREGITVSILMSHNSALGLRRTPLHVLVRRYAPACKAQGIQIHRFGLGEVPAGLMLEAAPEVYAAGPEACFAQMAREALRWVRDGSRSPMETVMSHLLYLPEEHGGLAFAVPQLNYEVKLDAVAAAVGGTAACSIDAARKEEKKYSCMSGVVHK